MTPEAASPYDEDQDVPAAWAGAVARAAATGRGVLVVLGGAWCPDCRVLDAMMASPAVAPVLADRFETVKVSVGRYDRNLDSVERLGAAPLKGAPAVLVFTAAGEAVGRGEMYAWRAARSRTPGELAVALDALSRAAPDPSDTVPTRTRPHDDARL
ncbi:MAG: thioredoxin family protein [Oceanicaulis sp.]